MTFIENILVYGTIGTMAVISITTLVFIINRNCKKDNIDNNVESDNITNNSIVDDNIARESINNYDIGWEYVNYPYTYNDRMLEIVFQYNARMEMLKSWETILDENYVGLFPINNKNVLLDLREKVEEISNISPKRSLALIEKIDARLAEFAGSNNVNNTIQEAISNSPLESITTSVLRANNNNNAVDDCRDILFTDDEITLMMEFPDISEQIDAISKVVHHQHIRSLELQQDIFDWYYELKPLVTEEYLIELLERIIELTYM